MKNIKELNEKINSCTECGLWKTKTNVLCGEGNLKPRLMLVAQAPGEKEDKRRKMFVGPSGQVLDEFLKKANIVREEIYMTNLIKCILPGYRKPKEDEITACSKHLNKEIEIINPQILVPLGYYATRYLAQKYGINLHGRDELHTVFSRLFWTGNVKIFPLPHPAAVLHNISLKEKMMKSYQKLKILTEDCKWYPSCPMKRLYEKGLVERKWIELYCKGDWEKCVRFEMEERGKPHPDWMLPDGSIDEKLHSEIYKMEVPY